MHLRILAAANRQPSWVDEGVGEYASRMPRDLPLDIRTIPLGQRGQSSKRGDTSRARDDEGQRMLKAIRPDDTVVALEVTGRALSTEALAKQLQRWREDGRDVWFLIGGPDGLSPACRERAGMAWSLSPLTLPHGLARIVVAEQLYRAWSVLAGHPYHRA